MLYDQDFHAKNIAEIPSALIGTKAPSLNLPPLEGSSLPALTYEAVKGKLTLVNVFAFWCITLRVGPFYDLSLKEGLFPAMEKAGLSISLIIHPPGAID